MTAAVLAVAIALRLWLWWSEGDRWSAADETVMARLGLAAAAPGYSYRVACHEWLAKAEAAKWPGIVRFGNLFLLSAIYRVTRRNSYYVPSAIATAASVGTLALSWRLAGASNWWVTAAVAFSPLQLHLGRRALQDQLVCFLTLAGLSLGLSGHLALAALVMATLVSVKETTALHMLAIGAALVFKGVPVLPVALTIAAASALYFAVFVALTSEPFLLWKLARRLTEARHDSYGVEHQQGAFHRLPADLFLLAPVAAFLAARSPLSPIAVFLIALVAIQSAIPILRSVRMVLAADVAIHVIAAGSGPIGCALVALSDLYVFWRVFHRVDTYDPVTQNIVTALGFAPRKAS